MAEPEPDTAWWQHSAWVAGGGGAGCRPATRGPALWVPLDADDPGAGAGAPPVRIDGPTIVIWHQPTCAACRLSEPLFRALERNTAGYAVVRREATRASLRGYETHVDTLPLYDFVWPAGSPPPPAVARPGAAPSPYGPGTVTESVRQNNIARIRQLVPALDVGGEEQQ